MAAVKKDNEDFKKAIRVLLSEKLISQGELAEKCGLSQQTVSAWLHNLRSPGVSAKRRVLKLIAESQERIEENKEILRSFSLSAKNYRAELAKIISTMNEEKCRRLLKIAKQL